MFKMKKFYLFLCSILLVFAGGFFVACGQTDYSNISLTADKNVVVMDVGEEQIVNFTIENYFNGMDQNLNFSLLSSPNSISFQASQPQNGTTALTITALHGGNVTLRAVTVEGLKECTISIIVNEYSSSLENNTNNLYLSDTTNLVPTSADFVFDDNSTARALDYYFYGSASVDDRPLNLQDVQLDGNYIKQFKEVKLKTNAATLEKYLVFTNLEGEEFTISEETSNIYANVPHRFIPVTQDFQGAQKVVLGQKFTFIARYSDELFVQRDFYVLKDIEADKITMQSAYVRGDNSILDQELKDITEIKLVPNRDDGLSNINHVDYKTVQLFLTLPSNSDLIDYTANLQDRDAVSLLKLREELQGDNKVVVYQISNRTITATNTKLIFQYYYKGFESEDDTSINAKIEIPIIIEFEPTKMSVNNEAGEQSSTIYTFYNNYASSSFGWQDFLININPNDAKFDNVVATFESNEVMLRYNNKTYQNGELVITDLSQPIGIKGVDSVNQVSGGVVTLRLNYNIIEPAFLEYRIRYNIVSGAKSLTFTDSVYRTEGVYLNYDEENAVSFNGLAADAPFNIVQHKFKPKNNDEVDVINFVDFSMEAAGSKYLVVSHIKTKAVGSGTYTLTLDNGTAIDVTFRVLEKVHSLDISLKDDLGIVTQVNSVENGKDIYLLNKNNTYNNKLSFALMANNNLNSTAIKNATLSKEGEECFIYSFNVTNVVNVDLTTLTNGQGKINFKVAYENAVDFKRTTSEKLYTVTIVSYSLINRMNVDQLLEDGITRSAARSEVYIGTDNTYARSVEFQVNTESAGYHFFQYSKSNFVSESFNKKFIYWTVEGSTMFYNENSYDNTYTVGNFGTFNTQTMTFTAFADAPSFVIYLVANIRQIDRVYSYTIELVSKQYNPVAEISLQEQIRDNQINFSANQTYKELVVNVLPINATNADITVIFTPNSIIEGEEKQEILLFGQLKAGKYEGISIAKIDDSSFLIRLDCSSFVKSPLSTSEHKLTGNLKILASDWLDETGNIKDKYINSVKAFDINYSNGTENNPFFLESASDVEKIADALNAHYKISIAIDMSASSDKLPLGNFSGSITGTNDVAKLYGLSIREGQEIGDNNVLTSVNYGLFSSLSESAKINNVKFEGSIEIENTSDCLVNAGLIAGENFGSLKNIGINITSNSKVNINGSGNIGIVVGCNYGEILQDFSVYTTEIKVEQYDAEGELIVDEKGNPILKETNPFLGLSTNILVFMGDYKLTIRSPKESIMKAGGVTGYNQGSIIKIDNPLLKLYGYSQYLAYANITAELNDLTTEETNFYYSNYTTSQGASFIGGVAGESDGVNAKIVGRGCFTDIKDENGNVIGKNYNIGEGILVGGKVEGCQYVGGIVGRFENFGCGNDETFFQGITSRAFVRGYTKNIGAISGFVSLQSNVTPNPFYAVQAVDDRRSGVEASMVIHYLKEQPLRRQSYDRNKIGFGANSTLQVLYDEDQTNKLDNILSYSKRGQHLIDSTGYIKIDDSSDFVRYYGDYIEVAFASDGNKVYYQDFFSKGEDEWKISANKAFSEFKNSNDVISTNTFYVNYFEVASVKTLAQDIASVQTILDEKYNTISAQSELYPISATNGLNFQSLNSDILTFDSQGVIKVLKKGTAQIKVSSLLNTNSSLNIYIKAVNYFNNNEDVSIIYPETSNDAIAVDEGRIELKGFNSVTLYIKPNYSFNNKMVIDKNGNASVDGLNFILSPNTEITSKVLITSFDNDTGYQTLEDFIDSTSCIDVTVNGQTINFSRRSNTLEGKYGLKFNSYLYSDNGLRAEVNKEITKTPLFYTRGAQSIQLKKHDSITITAKRVGVDTILINSSSVEAKPYFAIYDAQGNFIQGDFDEATRTYIELNNQKEGLFDILIKPEQSAATGLQEFDFSIAVNKFSQMFKDRHLKDIYGYYKIKLYAQSDTNKMTEIPIYFENMNVNSISVDNYFDIANVEQSSDFSTSSLKAHPGRTGLLIININPEEADLDYIEIVNTELSNQQGNGSATFNLVSKYTTGEQLFNKNTIAGSSIANGIRFNLQDIVEIYATKKDGKNLYEQYRGLIYVSYMVGTNGVNDGGLAQFEISAFKDGVKVGQPKILDLTLELDYHAYVTIDKAPVQTSQNNVYASYNVARGLRYQLNLDYYGFAFEDIELISSAPSIASIIQEQDKYYLQITSNDIDYSYFDLGYSVLVYVNAYHEEEDNPRSFSSITQFNILEYVINYQYTEGDTLLDIVDGMDEGVINVQVGNPQIFKVDLGAIIEYDRTLPNVKEKIDLLSASLSENAKWTAYTNINDVGLEGQAISVKDFDDKIYKKYNIAPNIPASENKYFRTQGLTITPTVTHKDVSSYYVFSMDLNFAIKEKEGVYEYSDLQASPRLYTEFKFNVYQSSSSDHPIPIYNIQELNEMQDNAHYILLADLTLDSSFQPLKTKIASLDGNGNTIYFNGRYQFNTSNMGLFDTIEDGTIIKNLNISLSGDTIFRNMTSNDFVAGLLAGQNNGSVTNCYAYSGHDEFDTTKEFELSCEYGVADSISYVAGLVGANSGNITNSRASVNITNDYNIGGLVGTNSGNIASSYFKNARLISRSNQNHAIGGLVVSNLQSGRIITSYASAENSSDLPFTCDRPIYDELGNIATLPKHYIQASTPEGGFAYTNLGTIEDCYSNIAMIGSNMAGFAFANGGVIKNSFSMSILENKRTASAGFSKNIVVDNSTGTFENCYYFYNSEEDEGKKTEGYVYTGSESVNGNYNPRYGEINSSIEILNVSGIERLNYKDFQQDNLDKHFSEYAYSYSATANTVWYYSDGSKYEVFDSVQFGAGRLELAASNLIAYSKKTLDGATKDEATGEVLYNYSVVSSKMGSLKNPRLIASAEEFEREILAPSSKSGFNNDNYRLISNIDYSSYDSLSSLYKIIYFGNLEGNGMTISNIDLISTDKMENAGMFAQIGRSDTPGTIMNLNLKPKEVSFANANCVGALAGTLSNGYLYNINVLSSEVSSSETGMAVLGNNFVGGVIGRTIDSFNMKNIKSELSAVAYNKPQDSDDDDLSYSQSSGNLDKYSYAGSIVGFAAGSGMMHKIYSEKVTDIMGSRIGVAIGGFDKNVKVTYLYVSLSDGLSLKGYDNGYVGLAVGEVKGVLENVQVSKVGSGEDAGADAGADLFTLMPGVPKAVGGVAGLINNGTITSAYVNQSFVVKALNNGVNIKRINYVGGIAGYAIGDNKLEKCVISASIKTSGQFLGGVIGAASGTLNMSEVAVNSKELKMAGQLTSGYIAGLIGSANMGRVNVSNCYTKADIILQNYVYTSQIDAYVSHFINNGTINLDHVFSTASIKVQLEDKRQVNGVQDIYYGEKEPGWSTDIHYERNQFIANDVYFYGVSAMTEGENSEIITDAQALKQVENLRKILKLDYINILSYKAKVDSSLATLHEQTFGMGSVSKIDLMKKEISQKINNDESLSAEEKSKELDRLLSPLKKVEFGKDAVQYIVHNEKWEESEIWSYNLKTLTTYLTMEDSFNWLK